MPSTISVREVNHPFDERDVCQVTELWHDYRLNTKDLPHEKHGPMVPCLVCRKALTPFGSEVWEVVMDHYFTNVRTFENTPVDRLLSWCYIEDLIPENSSKPKYEVKERGDFYYATIDIKDFYDEHFIKLEKEDETYKALYDTFVNYDDGLCFIGKVGFPIEDTNFWEFQNYIHLYCVRFTNNGQTLLAARNRMILEIAVAVDNQTRMVKV